MAFMMCFSVLSYLFESVWDVGVRCGESRKSLPLFASRGLHTNKKLIHQNVLKCVKSLMSFDLVWWPCHCGKFLIKILSKEMTQMNIRCRERGVHLACEPDLSCGEKRRIESASRRKWTGRAPSLFSRSLFGGDIFNSFKSHAILRPRGGGGGYCHIWAI